MKKLKCWLIKKLGGCMPCERTVITESITARLATVSATYEISFDGWKLDRVSYNPNEDATKHLCHQIAEELFRQGLCEARGTYDIPTNKVVYKTSLAVLVGKERGKE